MRKPRPLVGPVGGARAAAALALGAAIVLSGCSAVVSGAPAAAPATGDFGGLGFHFGESGAGDLGALLLAPEDFPTGYSALVLPYRDAVLASADLTGVSRDALINPVRCQPSAAEFGESDLAMISGMSAVGQSTIAVVLTRATESITDAKAAISRCLEVVSDQYGVKSQIDRVLLADPAAGNPGEFAYSQRVRSGAGDVEMTRDSITLVGQVGDVRIAVTGMSQQGAEVDRGPLDQLFAAAVAKAGQG